MELQSHSFSHSALDQGSGQFYAPTTLIPVPIEQEAGLGLKALESRKISRFWRKQNHLFPVRPARRFSLILTELPRLSYV